MTSRKRLTAGEALIRDELESINDQQKRARLTQDKASNQRQIVKETTSSQKFVTYGYRFVVNFCSTHLNLLNHNSNVFYAIFCSLYSTTM